MRSILHLLRKQVWDCTKKGRIKRNEPINYKENSNIPQSMEGKSNTLLFDRQPVPETRHLHGLSQSIDSICFPRSS